MRAEDNKTAVPQWQKAVATQDTEASSTSTFAPSEPPATMEQARKFLQDEEVQRYSREKKMDFLKGKGLSDSDIQQLITEETGGAQIQSPPTSTPDSNTVSDPAVLTTPLPTMPPPPSPEQQPAPSSQPVSDPAVLTTPPQTMHTPPPPSTDRPPIVTYPEFLTKPLRPPPLITGSRFLTTLYGFTALSSLVYGTSQYILAPMVESQTQSRIDFHSTAKSDLSKLVDKLSTVVSEIPSPGPPVDESVSEYDDPTELFHRDIGVQTSPPRSPTLSHAQTASSSLDKQTSTLARLTSSVRDLGRGFDGQKDDWEDIRAVMGVLKDELEDISYPSHDFVGGSNMYGYNREPDDEIRKMKEGIRRVKGVLLSARSFPAGR